MQVNKKDHLQCQICFENYDLKDKIPKVLKCGHTFCKSCSEQAVAKRLCPMCRSTFKGYEWDTKNIILTQLIETEHQKSQKRQTCDNHPDQKFVAFCTDDMQMLCVECIIKEHEPHKQITIEQYEKDYKAYMDFLDQIDNDTENTILNLQAQEQIIYDRVCQEWLEKNNMNMTISLLEEEIERKRAQIDLIQQKVLEKENQIQQDENLLQYEKENQQRIRDEVQNFKTESIKFDINDQGSFRLSDAQDQYKKFVDCYYNNYYLQNNKDERM